MSYKCLWTTLKTTELVTGQNKRFMGKCTLRNTWCVLQCSVSATSIRTNTRLWLIIFLCKDRREDVKSCFKSYSGELWTQWSLRELSSRREEIFLVSKAQKSLPSFVCVSLSLCTVGQTIPAQAEGLYGERRYPWGRGSASCLIAELILHVWQLSLGFCS